MKRLNKKGQSLSINTIIILILAIAVMVFLIAGFAIGWGKISQYLSGKNVKEVVDACSIRCSSGDSYNFCFEKKSLSSDDGKFNDVTCYFLSKDESMRKYGIAECPTISCDVVFTQGECTPGMFLHTFDSATKTLVQSDCTI